MAAMTENGAPGLIALKSAICAAPLVLIPPQKYSPRVARDPTAMTDGRFPLPPQLNGPRSIANPHSVPTPSRWHPPPATAHADSAGEEYVSVPEVSKVMEVMKVMEADEVVVWNHRGMVASPSGGHVWTMHTTSAVHTAHAMHAAHHRVGRHRWRGKHRHHDSASNR